MFGNNNKGFTPFAGQGSAVGGKPPQFGQPANGGNIFTPNTTGNNNLLAQGGNNMQGAAPNIFGQPAQQGQQGQQGQGIGGMFNNQTQTAGGIFNNQGQQPANNIYNQGQGQPNNNGFLQGQQGAANNLFNQGQQGAANNAFNQNQQTNNMFNQSQQGTNNLFNQGQQGMFNQGQQGMFNQGQQGNLFPQGQQGNANLNLAQLSTMTPEQQQNIIAAVSPQMLREAILTFKARLQMKKLEGIALSKDNVLANEKVSKVAANYNLKPALLQLKKLLKDNISSPIKTLKEKNDKLQELTADFCGKVFDKLQKYKERMLQTITQSKMVEEVRKEVEELDTQLKDFFRPLFNSYNNQASFSFVDPDPFCVKVSERLLKNMTLLDNKMDELLALEGPPSQDTVDTGSVIEELMDYYQNVAVTLRDFSERYGQVRNKVLARTRGNNQTDASRKIAELANTNVEKEMKAYDLVKEIEATLHRREKSRV